MLDRRTRALIGILTMCACTVLAGALDPHRARAAGYTATYSSADGAGWSRALDSGFSLRDASIDAAGSLGAGARGDFEFRPDVPHVRVLSARLTLRTMIASSGIVARAASVDGGVTTTTSVAGTTGTHLLDVEQPSDAVVVGLTTTNNVGAASASAELVGATLLLDDLRAPVITAASAVAEGGCTRFTVHVTDVESGLASVTLRDRRSLVALATWTGPSGSGLHPGTTAVTWQPCVAATALTNGVRSVDLDAVDVSGQHAFAGVVESAARVPLPDAASSTPQDAASAPLSIRLIGRPPIAVTFGAPLRVRAQVTRGGVGVEGRTLQLRSAAGAVLGSGRTTGSGMATVGGIVRGLGPFTVAIPGSNLSEPVATRVSPRATWMTIPATGRLNDVLRLRGQVRPASACRSITLQARRGAGWFVVRSGVRCAPNGAFVVPVTVNATGRFQLRAQVATRGMWRVALTSVRPLRVH